MGHLETLLLLARDPATHWTADTLSRELRTNQSMAKSQLKALMDLKFLNQTSQGAYYFDPVLEKDRELIHELAQIYKERRIMIINLIFSKPTERIRSLADAFRIRKGDHK